MTEEINLDDITADDIIIEFDGEGEEEIEFEPTIIELTNEDGETEKFELLDVVEYEDASYFVLGPELDPEAVFIMLVEDLNDGSDMQQLTPVEDEDQAQAIFQVFLEHMAMEDDEE